jgi:alpha-ketoglutarate-dependent taurine dioxygenase
MLSSTAVDPRAWRAETVDEPGSLYYPLPEHLLAALDPIVNEWRQSSRPVTDLQVSDGLRKVYAEELTPARLALEAGRGFVVLTASTSAPTDLQAIYWLIGQLLGRPVEQNVQGTLLYDVRDTGQDVRHGARFSVTSYESSFHTDNSFGADVVDYVGLLCITTAKSGGQSQLVSGYAVQQELLARHRDAWAILRQPFHIDRRGGLRPGDEPTVRFAVFAGAGPELLVRYLRYWIEVGHDKAGLPLTQDQVNALDTLDRVAGEKRLRVEFTLKPGEMLFVNNRWILHNRTAFEDHADPQRRRHYVRLWLGLPDQACL